MRPRRGSAVRKKRKRLLTRRRKVCRFCADKIDVVDYKDVRFLQQYLVDRAKILPRRISGTCSKHQRIVQQAIKRARHIALLPFTVD